MTNRIAVMRTAIEAFPKQGNREVFYRFDFSKLTSPYTMYLTEDMQRGDIDAIASVYIDNSLNASSVTLTFNGIFNILVQPNWQGVYPVICSGPTQLQISTAGNVAVGVILSNTPKDYASWGPISATATFATPTGAFTNRSTTITVGGTSQQLAPINANRKRIYVENPATAAGQGGIAAAESLFINFTTAAGVNNGTSVELLPGGIFDSGSGPVTTEAITVNAATTGHAFIAKEM
jgi:hypothetical protein